jgi:hypothetical protein
MRRGKRKMAECGFITDEYKSVFLDAARVIMNGTARISIGMMCVMYAMKTVANNGNDGRGFRKLVKRQLSILFHLEYCYHTCSYF